MSGTDTLSLLRSWAGAPLKVGSLAASTSTLATLMTREIGPECGQVLELGSGSGNMTRALLGQGVKETNLALVELDAESAQSLRKRFPKARVLEMDATCLRHLPLFEGTRLGAAVCNLSLMTLPPRHVMAILDGVFSNIRHGGALYLYTYGLRCPIEQSMLDSMDLVAARVGHTFMHMPPATVYRVTKMDMASSYDWRCA